MRAPTFAFALLLACGGTEPAPTTPTATPSAEAPTPAPSPAATEAPEPDEPDDPAPEPPRIVAGTRAPLTGEPVLRLAAPTDGSTLRRRPVELRAQLTGFELGAAPVGNHLHVRLDDGPEMAVYDLSAPIALDALVREATGGELAPGSHVLRLFLGRADHESVKREGARITRVIHVGQRTRDFAFDPRAPRLVYSRPQGCSSSRTRLLDFQLENVPALAADGFRITYELDGEHTGAVTEWVPHRIENLARGTHTLVLTLVGPDGEPVPGNRFERTFISDADCPSYAVNAYQPVASEDPDAAEDDEQDL